MSQAIQFPIIDSEVVEGKRFRIQKESEIVSRRDWSTDGELVYCEGRELKVLRGHRTEKRME